MKQVCLRDGAIAVADVPAPLCQPNGVLVRTWHSVISSGTELATTSTSGGTMKLLARAAADPELLRRVWNKVQAVGVRQTTELVRARQQSSLPLGYSAAGEVIDVGAGVTHLAVGDLVACAGAGYANHAEINFVPKHLAARVPPSVPTADAAFVTLGAIALHGVRRLAPAIGDQIVVVGLGLLGQLTVQLLRAAGCRVLGIDLNPERAALARTFGAELAIDDSHAPLAAVTQWTAGALADGAIVCASAKDGQLLNRCFDLLRRKGRLVLVGDVPIRVSREAIYRKELEFLISTSYGPGRYDQTYEEQGQDYPRAYVRWTEGRNLEEVLRLLASGVLNVRALTGLTVAVDEAGAGYARLAAPEPPVAVVLEYGHRPPVPAAPRAQKSGTVRTAGTRVVLGVIGAGSFLRGVHLPNLQRHPDVTVKYLVARNGLAVQDLARSAGIAVATTSVDEVLADEEVDAVVITTRHDQHADLACRALEARKHVFVEKPLGLTIAECDRVVSTARRTGGLVAVGFNRRFAPLAVELREAIAAIHEPRTILIRVNAGGLSPDHWLLDPVQGGGRLRGEGVHFFDLARWLAGSRVATVGARSIVRDGGPDPDSSLVTIGFDDGSLASIHYISQGSGALAKERVEVFGGGAAFVLDDFRRLISARVKQTARDVGRTDKGHSAILNHFIDTVRGRATLSVTAEDGLEATRIAEQALDALAGRSQT